MKRVEHSRGSLKRDFAAALLRNDVVEAMRSQLRFAMHGDDETEFLAEVLRDPTVLLIDGPRWKDATPTTTRDVSSIGRYCIVWSPDDLAALTAEYMPRQDDWFCQSGFATIEFSRCTVENTVILDGRIAVSTYGASQVTAKGVERRFNDLRRAIKKTYRNSIIQWFSTSNPSHPPSKPDNSFWVGPAALNWLRSDARRCVKQLPQGLVEGRLVA